jgi:hypothetical protein
MNNKIEMDSINIQKTSVALARFVGYILLILSVIDYVNIFVPIKLMNSAWELQTIQELVERVAAPLIGLALVFSQQLDFRSKKEIFILKLLSWTSLAVGILYFLLLPILVVNNIRLDTQLNQQVATQIDQRTDFIERVEQQLIKSNSQSELQSLFARLSGQALSPELQTKSSAELKAILSQQLAKTKPTVRSQIESVAQSSRFSLMKRTVKLLLEALISGAAFIYIWHLTQWVRRSKTSALKPKRAQSVQK